MVVIVGAQGAPAPPCEMLYGGQQQGRVQTPQILRLSRRRHNPDDLAAGGLNGISRGVYCLGKGRAFPVEIEIKHSANYGNQRIATPSSVQRVFESAARVDTRHLQSEGVVHGPLHW
jgi:hypothetical protein